MVVIRGTKKFLDRVGAPTASPPPSTTALGDWYGTVLFGRPQVGLFVNERTLLPVLMPFAPGATAPSRLSAQVATVLELHALAGAFVNHELEAMAQTALAKTASRSVIGMLTEFAALSGVYRQAGDANSLIGLSLRLADTPCGPLYKTHITPRRAVAAVADEWIFAH